MKRKESLLKKIISICSMVILCCLILSSCASNDIDEFDNSVALIKNASMSTYGTGFAVGIPGKAVDTIVTSYSVVATLNGAAPKLAEVRINESAKSLIANVSYYDAAKNIAILKLSAPTKELKPMVLRQGIDYDETVHVTGYDGTGNIMSDYEKFNTTDIVRYDGHVSTYDELNTMVVYQYSNEFNRAVVGGPAFDDKGNVVGMCAYSLNSMNTYSQYILSSEELIGCFIREKIEFITADGFLYKNIIILTIVIGMLLLVAIIVCTLIISGKGNSKKNKKEKNNKVKNNEVRKIYLKVTGGTLNGRVYELKDKISIGRDSARCEVAYPVNEPGISAVHCSLYMKDNVIYLADEYSKYGTFLANGTKISASEPYKTENLSFAFYIAGPENRFELTDKEDV